MSDKCELCSVKYSVKENESTTFRCGNGFFKLNKPHRCHQCDGKLNEGVDGRSDTTHTDEQLLYVTPQTNNFTYNNLRIQNICIHLIYSNDSRFKSQF